MAQVILLGDFDAHTIALQIPFHDRSKDMFYVKRLIQIKWEFTNYLTMLWGLLQGMANTSYDLENPMSY